MKQQISLMEEMFCEYDKMSQVLYYLMEHLNEEITTEQLCKRFEYSKTTITKKFKQCLGVTCEQFIVMLRMREAARELLGDKKTSSKSIVEKYGFSGMSPFSKAFKREIGVAPRIFQNTGKSVPDMPLPKTINKQRLFFKYMKTEDFEVYGYKIPLIKGIRTDLLKECAYPLEHESEHLDLYGNKDQIGFWWGGAKDEMYYILGYKVYSRFDIPEDAQVFLFEGTNYAVFSVERDDSLEKTLLNHRTMVYYAMMFWQMINHKEGNPMNYTYEVFGKNYTYLYLPIKRGMPEEETEISQKSAGIDDWITYIDLHIKEKLSLEDIAAQFNYSKRHFCRMFKNYYEYSVSDYIRKERLYLAARELKDVDSLPARNKIIRQYHFNDEEHFQRNFENEFHEKPEDYHNVSFSVPNLAQYYLRNMNQIKTDFIDSPEISMAGRIIKARNLREDVKDNLDIPDLASYWMRNDPDELKGTCYECPATGSENKMALWFTDTNSGNNEYILGPVVKHDAGEIPDGYRKITIPAGRYVVIESKQKYDDKRMTQTYRLLSRCAYGWIKAHQYRVDLNRISFVRYYDRKLHFYVPVYE